MICYLVVQKIGSQYLPLGATRDIPADLKSTQRIIKLDIEITDDAWDYPTVKVVWPDIPTVLPEKMVDDLKHWAAGDPDQP